MQMDDMILVSIDDHMIEPPDLFENHVPAKWKDEAPKLIRNENGVDEWHFQGRSTSTPFGMAATVGWPREEWGFNPGSYSELRPGCFDVHQRVRDMDANGVLALAELPHHGRFQRPHVQRGRGQGDRPRDDAGLQRLGHRRVVRRSTPAASSPSAWSPTGIPSWPPTRSTASPRRAAGRSASSRRRTSTACPASCPVTGTRCSRRSATRTWCCRCTSAPASRSSNGHPRRRSTTSWCWPPRSPPSPRRTCSSVACSRSSPTCGSPCPRAASGGCPSTSTASTATGPTRRGCTAARNSAASCPPRCSASTSWPASSPIRPGSSCVTASAWTSSPGSATTPTPTRPGPSRPSSPGASSRTSGVTDKAEIDKITFENACRFFDWDPFAHTNREDATVGALRARATDVDTTRMSRAEWKQQNEAAGIGVF